MNTVSTNLIGRWAKGYRRRRNPTYVVPDGDFLTYTRSQRKTLTEEQMTKYVWDEITEKIVAVTCEGSSIYAELVLWILVDGKTGQLEQPTIMPEGWSTPVERL